MLVKTLTLLVYVCAATPALSQCLAPGHFVASQGTVCTGVSVSWAAVGGASLYRLYKNTSSSFATAIDLGAVPNTVYTDSSVVAGQTYYYWVRTEAGGCGQPSLPTGPASGFMPAPLTAPTGMRASDGAGCAGVFLSWDAGAGATGWEVWRSPVNSLASATLLSGTSNTWYSDPTPAPGQHMYYWVRATGPCAPGPFTSSDSGYWSTMGGLPDLVMIPSYLSGWTVSTNQGAYQLRGSSGFGNFGQGPLHLFPGTVFSDGTRNVMQLLCSSGQAHLVGRFPTQTEFDITPFARYRLRERPADQSVGAVVAENTLTTFCLSDLSHFNASLPGSPVAGYYQCGQIPEGISIGWGTIYGSSQPGQSLSLACARNGDYWLEAELDPAGMFVESNLTNNIARLAITLTTLPAGNGVTFTSQPASRRVCTGASVTLAVGVTAASPLFAWYHGTTPLNNGPTPGGSVISGAASASLAISGVYDADAGQYQCLVTSGACARYSSAALLTVNSADFNGDGDTGTDGDLEAFFTCLAGSCCATCGSADFNGDGDIGTDADIEAFFRVLAGGTC